MISDATRSAAVQRDALLRLIDEWERVEGPHAAPARKPERDAVSPREIIASWLDVKENAARAYRWAAAEAPTAQLRERLTALAEEEEVLCARMRRLL